MNRYFVREKETTSSYVEVEPDPADVGTAWADGVGAGVLHGGGGRLHQRGAVLGGHPAAAEDDCRGGWGDKFALTLSFRSNQLGSTSHVLYTICKMYYII